MNMLKVEKIELHKSKQGSMLSFNLCNKFSEKYYIEDDVISQRWEDTLYGYTVSQNGINIPYEGTTIKRKVVPKKFPDGYTIIEPNKCITVNVNISKFFHFNEDKEVTINYKILNYQPDEVKLEKESFNQIEFEKTLMAK